MGYPDDHMTLFHNTLSKYNYGIFDAPQSKIPHI